MTAYLPVLAYLGLWLLLAAGLGLLRRLLAGSSRQPASFLSEGAEVDSGGPWRSLARLAPALSGAVLLLAAWAAGPGAEPSGGAVLPALLLVLVVAIALVHGLRRSDLSDAPETP